MTSSNSKNSSNKSALRKFVEIFVEKIVVKFVEKIVEIFVEKFVVKFVEKFGAPSGGLLWACLGRGEPVRLSGAVRRPSPRPTRTLPDRKTARKADPPQRGRPEPPPAMPPRP